VVGGVHAKNMEKSTSVTRTMYDLTLTVIILSCSVMQCSMDTLKFVCSWHGRIPGARLSVKVQYCH